MLRPCGRPNPGIAVTIPADSVPPSLTPPPIDGPPTPPPQRVISGFWRRLAALLLDYLVLGVMGMALGFTFYDSFVHLAAFGRFIGYPIALIYFGLCNSAYGDGKTVGKRALEIEVVDAAGGHLSTGKSFLRALVFTFPFLFNGLTFHGMWAHPIWVTLFGFVLFIGVIGCAYFFLFNRGTRQVLHDLVVQSWVVRAQPTGPVPARRIWTGHLIIGGALCVLIVAGSFALAPLVNSGKFKPLLAASTAVGNEPHVSTVGLLDGTTVSNFNGLRSVTHYVALTVVVNQKPASYDRSALELVRPVLADRALVRGKDFISVTITYGFDVFVAHWHVSHTIRHTPKEWMDLNDDGSGSSPPRGNPV